MRIITANLNGIRSATNKGFFAWLQTTQADVVCLQELKAQAGDMTAEMLAALPSGMPASSSYYGYFHYAEKKGYSGVGIYSKTKPDDVIIGLSHFDNNMAQTNNHSIRLSFRINSHATVAFFLGIMKIAIIAA